MIQPRTEHANDGEMDIPADDADAQLWLQRLARGDRRAFWAIWMSYQEELFCCCLRWMGGDREEAEDALSSASLKAWQHLPACAEDIVHVKGWLSRLLYNHCMSIRQTRKRHALLMQKISTQPAPALQPSECESPEDVMSRQEMLQDVHYAMDNLPPRLHVTAELRLVRNLTYREIASQLNLSPENARKRVQEARAILRTSLFRSGRVNKASQG